MRDAVRHPLSALRQNRGNKLPRSLPRAQARHERRGMLLVVVLLIIALLTLVGATFSYRMNADLAAVRARKDLLQAEQAARAGIDRVIKVLRDSRVDIDQWYSNPDKFRRMLVCVPGDDQKIGGSESLADQEPIP